MFSSLLWMLGLLAPAGAAAVIPGAIAWLIGGGILRTVAAVAVSAPLAFGAGYLTGYSAAGKAHGVAALQRTVENLTAEIAARNLADAEAAKEAEAEAKAETENTERAATIEADIQNAKEVPSGFTRNFLDGLRGLK